MFDFVRFCEDHNIRYVTRGVNVKASDDCNISCPFCNDSPLPDPSYHLGVTNELQAFSCWRNPTHRGRTLHRLIMKLLRCSYDKAREILGQQPLWLKEGRFEELFDAEDLFAVRVKPVDVLTVPTEFRQFAGQYQAEQRFKQYLADRGFHGNYLNKVLTQYGMYWAISGPFKQRVILTNERDGELLNWTGRSIQPHQSIRYLSLSEEDGAVVGIKQVLWNFDQLVAEPQTLCLVHEGPFDALKVDVLGQRFGLRATCVFGQSATLEQLGYLTALTDLYDQVVVMFDRDSEDRAEAVASQLCWLPVTAVSIPDGIKDPGEMTLKQVKSLAQQLLKGA